MHYFNPCCPLSCGLCKKRIKTADSSSRGLVCYEENIVLAERKEHFIKRLPRGERSYIFNALLVQFMGCITLPKPGKYENVALPCNLLILEPGHSLIGITKNQPCDVNKKKKKIQNLFCGVFSNTTLCFIIRHDPLPSPDSSFIPESLLLFGIHLKVIAKLTAKQCCTNQKTFQQTTIIQQNKVTARTKYRYFSPKT